MATSHQPQMATNHFLILITFTIAGDCPQENREIIYKNNIKFEE